MPSVLEYINRKNALPKGLLFSLAALIAFYKGNRNGESFAIKDDQNALDFFATQWATGDLKAIAKATLKNTDFWGTDLTQFDGLLDTVTANLEAIINNGMKEALGAFVQNNNALK